MIDQEVIPSHSTASITASTTRGKPRTPPRRAAPTITTGHGHPRRAIPHNPWLGFAAMGVGFFMILVDSTIISVATPAMMAALNADINGVVWVTSAYLLAYAVPLLITGRLGDRFGPKNVYLLGLTVFTLASLWCALTTTLSAMVAARVVQGLGAALMTPQTMAVITRTFPAGSRGKAMGMWGAVAGVATLVGPILGGVLVDGLGWEWIFFVNVPVGILGFALAWLLVPHLPTHEHTFDAVGIVLSALGMFSVVFGIQEGSTYHWGQLWGPLSVAGLISTGVGVLAVFVLWQRFMRTEPLMPLRLFRDRNFSLANIAMPAVSFAMTAMAFPIMLWAQAVRGYSPTRASLLMVPMAVLSGILAPFVGGLVDRNHPRFIAAFGLTCFSAALVWLYLEMTPTVPVWRILLPMTLLGVGTAFMFAPITTTANRNLPLELAGAGSGVYNTMRQTGSVLGSASISSLMEARLASRLGAGAAARTGTGTNEHLPPNLVAGFSAAMGESLLLPAAVLVVAIVAVIFFELPHHLH